MPARKTAVRLPNAKNNGKSTTGKYLDDYPQGRPVGTMFLINGC